MLTDTQKRMASKQLNEKFEMLGYDAMRVSHETEIPDAELQRVLSMTDPYPGNVWKLRAYLDDKLRESGIVPQWKGALVDPSANKWYPYDTPWR